MTSLLLALRKFEHCPPGRPKKHGSILLDEILVETVVKLVLDTLRAKTPYKRAQAGFDANSVWHRMKHVDFSNTDADYVIAPSIVSWCKNPGPLEACPDEVWGSKTINVCVDFLTLISSNPQDHDTCLAQIKDIRARLKISKGDMPIKQVHE